MTTYNKTQLKTFFEQGDVPQGSDYSNLIDSQVNIAETGGQSMAGPLTTTKLSTPLVSAATGNITGNLTIGGALVGNIAASAASFTGSVSAASLNVTGDIKAADGRITASAGTFSGGIQTLASGAASFGFQASLGSNTNGTPNAFEVLATNLGATSTFTGFQFHNVSVAASSNVSTINAVNITAPSFGTAASAGTVRGINIANLGSPGRMGTAVGMTIAFQNGANSTSQCINCASDQFIVDGLGAVLNGVAITSASGIAIGTAAQLSYNNIVRGIGTVDGAATGYGLIPNKAGLVQNFIYEGSVSANLWPPGSDYRINTLASGVPFPLAANTPYTIICKTASAYSVK